MRILACPGSFLSGRSLPPAQSGPGATRKRAIQHQAAGPAEPSPPLCGSRRARPSGAGRPRRRPRRGHVRPGISSRSPALLSSRRAAVHGTAAKQTVRPGSLRRTLGGRGQSRGRVFLVFLFVMMISSWSETKRPFQRPRSGLEAHLPPTQPRRRPVRGRNWDRAEARPRGRPARGGRMWMLVWSCSGGPEPR